MSKDKRKKKYFQGMEHLQHQAIQQPAPSANAQVSLGTQISTESEYIKKDLRNVIILMSIIVLLMAGLTILDKKTDKLTTFAEKITSVVIK
jgi:hypothetical protein